MVEGSIDRTLIGEACETLGIEGWELMTPQELQATLDSTDLMVSARQQRIRNGIPVPPLDKDGMPILSNTE